MQRSFFSRVFGTISLLHLRITHYIVKSFIAKNPWVAVADNILRKVGGCKYFQFQSNLSEELIDVWKSFSDGVVKDVEFILFQSLWNNKFITSKNDTLYSI